MKADSLLERMSVAAPCSARWEDMEGDERARFCRQCEKHVFNFSAMTRDEAEALIREKEGKLCGRFYRRRDGRVLTANCPIGRSRQRSRLARLCGLLFATVLFSLGIRAALQPQEERHPEISRLNQKIRDLIYQARLKLGLAQPPMLMGEIMVLPPPSSAPVPPAQSPSGN